DEGDEGVQIVAPDEYDQIFGDGSDIPELPDDSAVSPTQAECIKKFNDALDAVKIACCGTCREEGFHIKLKNSGECGRCHADKRDTKLWSDGNNVNPSNQRPECLKNLTDMEEMLIARVKPVMQVRWTRG
ncbi:hypothetical protein C8F04DRAFT_918176, partial [Mycena alexandri]